VHRGAGGKIRRGGRQFLERRLDLAPLSNLSPPDATRILTFVRSGFAGCRALYAQRGKMSGPQHPCRSFGCRTTGAPLNPLLIHSACELRDKLAMHRSRLVLAESCTAGHIAATLGCLPGISAWFCGSFVVYRCESKTRWLGIPAAMLEAQGPGPVSAEVTHLLAEACLGETPEARFSLAITGDLGPRAPAATDGVCFLALCDRITGSHFARRILLAEPSPTSDTDIPRRVARLEEATQRAIESAIQWIQTAASSNGG